MAQKKNDPHAMPVDQKEYWYDIAAFCTAAEAQERRTKAPIK